LPGFPGTVARFGCAFSSRNSSQRRNGLRYLETRLIPARRPSAGAVPLCSHHAPRDEPGLVTRSVMATFAGGGLLGGKNPPAAFLGLRGQSSLRIVPVPRVFTNSELLLLSNRSR